MLSEAPDSLLQTSTPLTKMAQIAPNILFFMVQLLLIENLANEVHVIANFQLYSMRACLMNLKITHF